MEEKVLIKSVTSKKTKQVFIGVAIALLIVSIIFLVLANSLGKQDWAYNHYGYYFSGYYYECYYCGDLWLSNEMVPHILEYHSDKFDFSNFFVYGLVWLILHWSFIFLAVVVYLIYFLISRCNITITDKNISGRTFWGKEVVLPIHMVSAYSISKIFSVVAITSASGSIKFPGIGNYEEIVEVLQELLNERQKRTETQENLSSQQNDSRNLDYLIKLKNLLDSGIITKEEYDAKKKEILGF